MTFTSSRGRIDPPPLDDRNWAALVEQMRALIPTYSPAWTDHNPSDLGMTLIELFAWLGETILYRLNQTPTKNYIAFLKLLGVVRAPASPAETYLTFATGASGVVVPAGTQAQTAAGPDQSVVVFETDEPVSLLPTTLAAALTIGPYDAGAAAAAYVNDTDVLVGPPTGRKPLSVPGGKVLTVALGFRSSVNAEFRLGLRLDSPLTAAPGLKTEWVYGRGTTEPMAWPAVPGAVDGDGTLGLTRSGVVRLTPPADWAARRATASAGTPGDQAWASVTAHPGSAQVTDPLFWLGIRINNPNPAPVSLQIDRLLFNTALARSAATIRTPDVLGRSSGAPFQVLPLANRPLYRGSTIEPSYDHLVVQIGSGTPTVWETWDRVDQLAAGGGKAYVLNPVSAEISFGNHDDQHPAGHGRIPPAGSLVQALRYRYVSTGAAGNIAPAQIVTLGSTLTGAPPAGVTQVTNLGPGIGGVDEEPIEDTLRRAPDEFKVRNRAVTAEDYEKLAREPGFVAISRCLEPRLHKSTSTSNPPLWKVGDPWTYAGIERARGNVTVIIVPDQGPDVPTPNPTVEQLADVQGYLDHRRDLTAKLAVVGPRYLPIAVTVVITVWPAAISAGVNLKDLKADTLAKIRLFLHPTRGGLERTGWEIGESVFTSQLFQALQPSADIGFISDLSIAATVPAYHFPPLNPLGTAANWKPVDERPFGLGSGSSVRLADYELVCAAADHTIDTPTLTD